MYLVLLVAAFALCTYVPGLRIPHSFDQARVCSSCTLGGKSLINKLVWIVFVYLLSVTVVVIYTSFCEFIYYYVYVLKDLNQCK